MKQLSELNAVKKKLQPDDSIVCSTQAYFDTLSDDYPTRSNPLDGNVPIVHNSHFMSAVSNSQKDQESLLQATEKEQVCGLLLEQGALGLVNNGDDYIIERAAERLLSTEAIEHLQYHDTCFLLQTCNTCERVFSITSHALTNRRKRKLLSNFEAQLLL